MGSFFIKLRNLKQFLKKVANPTPLCDINQN